MRQQGGEEVLGEGVHGDALPVDDLAQPAERTRCTRRRTTHRTHTLLEFVHIRPKTLHDGFSGESALHLLVTGRPVSSESEPAGRPAAALEAWPRSAPRCDTPGEGGWEGVGEGRRDNKHPEVFTIIFGATQGR